MTKGPPCLASLRKSLFGLYYVLLIMPRDELLHVANDILPGFQNYPSLCNLIEGDDPEPGKISVLDFNK